MNLISGKHKAIGLLGHPVEHTLSPLIHSVFADSTGERVVYMPFDVQPENVKDALYGMRAMGFLGTNATIPYKDEVIKYLDYVEPSAKRLDSVNTIVFEKGKLSGYSTDGEGFLLSLSAAGIEVSGRNIAIFGTGGAARAVLPVLLSQGAAHVGIIARNRERAEALCKLLGDRASVYDYDEIKNADILINSTPLGMGSSKGLTPAEDLSMLKRSAAVVDMVYNPRKTRFMKDAHARGNLVCGGLGMLVYQAALAFSYFTNKRPSTETIDRLLGMLQMEKSIVLTGFMGSGKSTVGKLLAAQLSTEFIDTDQEIEKEAGMTIPEIFFTYGEAHFRELEKSMVKKVVGQGGAIIAVGGGAVLDRDNIDYIMSNSLVFRLKPTPYDVLANLKKESTRPLISRKSDAEILELMEKREPFYKRCHKEIETEGLNISQAVESIIEKYFKTSEEIKE